MAADSQRPAEDAALADREARMAADMASMKAAQTPHVKAMETLSPAAPAGGYGGEQGLS